MRLGLVGYTNKSSGIGLFVYELWKYLDGDSILSIDAGIKGREVWTERQLNAKRPPSKDQIAEYFEKYEPTHILFLETPFSDSLYDIAQRHGVKVVGIPMAETFNVLGLRPDLLICPSLESWRKTSRRAKLLFLPIGLELFPFKLRKGHTFVLNIGYGGPHDRRQSVRVVQAFEHLGEDARLIINTQATGFPKEIEKLKDPRIQKHLGSKPLPKDIYSEGDIAINIMAYGGYERPILESMASGMPCLTTNADPMNLFQHDSDFLMEPSERILIKSTQWVTDTYYNKVSVDDLIQKMRWLQEIDTEKYSKWARRQAEAQSWESGRYKDLWLETIEEA